MIQSVIPLLFDMPFLNESALLPNSIFARSRQPLRTQLLAGSLQFSMFRLPLGQAIPARRCQRVIGHSLDCARDEGRAAPVTAEAGGLSAVGVPDVECRAEDVAPRVVDQVAAEVLAAEKDVDVAGGRENPRIRGDYAVTRLPAAAGFALHAVLSQGNRNRHPILGAGELGRNER